MGIGLTAPTARLHIRDGNLRIDNGEIQSWGAITLHPDVDNSGDDIVSFVNSAGTEVMRVHSNGNVGIGTSNPVYPLHVEAAAGTSVFGKASSSSGLAYGGRFESNSTDGSGVYGFASATSGFAYGGWFESASTLGTGVYGLASATSGLTYGVYGLANSTDGTGVYGWTIATSGTAYGVHGRSNSTSGRGVFGEATATSGTTYGVYGRSNSTGGSGVAGVAFATSGTTYGVIGQSASTNGTGVYGLANATSGVTYGVYGQSASTDGKGVLGWAIATSGPAYGVQGRSDSTDGRGVFGVAIATSGSAWGVAGTTFSPASTAYGVRGSEPSSGAGHAVYAEGTLAATGTKSFQMDHPLHPETHYLNHFCTEGPEPYNAYSGNVVTDAQGYATVQLPDYFESINRDFRYQLTVIDGAGEEFVQARVVRKIQNNQFVIRTSKPFVEVSWRVEAIRNDRWVQEYGYQAEQPKPAEHQGKYLHPELYGQPKERGIHYHPEPEREVTPAEPVRQ